MRFRPRACHGLARAWSSCPASSPSPCAHALGHGIDRRLTLSPRAPATINLTPAVRTPRELSVRTHSRPASTPRRVQARQGRARPTPGPSRLRSRWLAPPRTRVAAALAGQASALHRPRWPQSSLARSRPYRESRPLEPSGRARCPWIFRGGQGHGCGTIPRGDVRHRLEPGVGAGG